MTIRNKIANVCLLLLAGYVVPAAHADDRAASEYAVKAAIVYKITKFVSWPNSAFDRINAPLNVCVMTGSPFIEPMRSLEGRKVRGHSITLVTFEAPGSVAGTCHVLVLSDGEAKKAESLLASSAAEPILTVGDSDAFAKRGGIVGLEVEKSRVVFAINVEASQRAGLDISAQLLQLARIVADGA